ncbi:MAG: hypothetical protein R3C29_02980 [Dehalococcoidia bacterium]
MKALLTLDGSQNSESILPTAQTALRADPDLELHMLTVLDPKSVHGTRSEPVDDEGCRGRHSIVRCSLTTGG